MNDSLSLVSMSRAHCNVAYKHAIRAEHTLSTFHASSINASSLSTLKMCDNVALHATGGEVAGTSALNK